MSCRLKLLTTLAAVFVATYSMGATGKSSGSEKTSKGRAMVTNTVSTKKTTPKFNVNDLSLDNGLLLNRVMPMLKLNEGFKLNFYRCSRNKVTVGYGSNVEDNAYLLNNVSIYRNGVPLKPDEKKAFLQTMTQKKTEDLKKYTITATDADRMARSFAGECIPKICKFLSDDKTKKTFFYDLPLSMQILCVDMYYNLSEKKFAKYKKFKAALQRKDWAGAINECTVYVDKETKRTNLGRERRKKYLLNILNLVLKNPKATPEQLRTMLENDYRSSTPKRIRIFSEKDELNLVKTVLIGEMSHQTLLKRRAEQRAQSKTVAQAGNSL